MTNPIITEDTVTDMQSEHVDTLKREIETKDRQIGTLTDEVNILAHILSEVIDANGVDSSFIVDIMDEMTADRETIINILDGYNVVANHWFIREYEVTVNIPVTLTMRVEALSKDDAEEQALNHLDWGRLTDYDLDYNVHYDADIMEVREA